jgi:hypothetical protein
MLWDTLVGTEPEVRVTERSGTVTADDLREPVESSVSAAFRR